MPRTRVETRARARVLQALYAWSLRTDDVTTLERIATQIWDDLGVAADERALAAQLVRTIGQHAAALDRQLADVTTNWRLDRLAVVDRSVLRLGAAELHRGETPPRVVIHEAVRLAERYSGLESAKFVNGVLDALARQMGRM